MGAAYNTVRYAVVYTRYRSSLGDCQERLVREFFPEYEGKIFRNLSDIEVSRKICGEQGCKEKIIMINALTNIDSRVLVYLNKSYAYERYVFTFCAAFLFFGVLRHNMQ